MPNPTPNPSTQNTANTPAAMPATALPAQRRLHPLLGAAAVAIVVASLTAVAAMTGLLPVSKATQDAPQSLTAPIAAQNAAASQQQATPGSTTRPPEAMNPALAQAADVPVAQPSAARPAPQRAARADTGYGPEPARAENAGAQPQRQPAQGGASLGRVVAITPIETAKPASGLGAVGGAVVGGLLGNQIGKGNGRILGTVAGAVGGGFAGNQIEKSVRKDTSYQVRVQMDNGTHRTFTYHAAPDFEVGERVRLQDGGLVAA
ncbi:glycine zipper 2TM domain-containing protein [Cupriavidus sp. 2TAF22]|uniref:glycine zipper 2TM domain-containing protein n=1 Tax=unclassified Cupriavidus TaxID=2640874 RepID=UPI003F8EA02D